MPSQKVNWDLHRLSDETNPDPEELSPPSDDEFLPRLPLNLPPELHAHLRRGPH